MHNHSNEVPFHALHDHELLTIEDPAEVLRTPVNTMRWWRQVGREPQFFNIGRRLSIEVGDLQALILKQRIASNPDIPRPKTDRDELSR